MGILSKIKFIFRSILLGIFMILFTNNKEFIVLLLNKSIFLNIKLFHIIWFYLFAETLFLVIPFTNKHSYNGKLFLRHYIPVEKYNSSKLEKYTKFNNKTALSVMICWLVLNFILATIYFNYKLDITYVYLVFLIYYWCDMFCVNVWCPFNALFFKNKCCNECRIYNWDHIMFSTPLLLIKSFWSYSIIFLSLFAFLQWEYMVRTYPERFSPISNRKLQCNNCTNKCRFKKTKHTIKKQLKEEEVNYEG